MGEIIGYARVSSADQDLTIQVGQLTLAGCTKVFFEKKSGVKLTERSELEKCLAYVREGDTLVVTRLDRFSRSVSDFNNLINYLQTKKVEFRCLLQPFDTTSATGKLMMQLLAAFAEFETTVRKERQREGIEKARANGVYKHKIAGRNSQLYSSASKKLTHGLTYEQVSEQTGIPVRSLKQRYPNYNKRGERKPKPEPRGFELATEPPFPTPPSAGEPVEPTIEPEVSKPKRRLFGVLLGD